MTGIFHRLGLVGIIACLGGWHVTAAAQALPQAYRDKHGNRAEISLGLPVANLTGTGIDYTVGYTSSDSVGGHHGEFRIVSEYLPGRDPFMPDFGLTVQVVDYATQKGAALVFRNHAMTAPAMPVLRLLDCTTSPCTEEGRNDNPEWGAWIIRSLDDLATYPIELLDARVLGMFLSAEQLAHLPNESAGTGNWAEILLRHRTNLSNAKFRLDIDSMTAAQSELVTDRIVAEVERHVPLSADDWLYRHTFIEHGRITFVTGHSELIEAMTDELHNNYVWPTSGDAAYAFAFGRMPIWLVDGDHEHDYLDPCDDNPETCHQLPLHWERVTSGLAPLEIPGCWHDFSPEAFAPIIDNGDTVADPGEGLTHIGQFECAEAPNADGYPDRLCTNDADYFADGAGSGVNLWYEVEMIYHNPVHGYIGGPFMDPAQVAGTMVFWAFHTSVSTNAYANWVQAQKRSIPAVQTIPAMVDVRSRDERHRLGRGRGGVVPVSVLGSADFSAASIDPASLRLEATGVPPHNFSAVALRDVNRDGFDDLTAYFPVDRGSVTAALDELCLVGATESGSPFRGCDAVSVAPASP